MNIYLAGNMHTNWRREVADRVKGGTFLWPHKAPNRDNQEGGDSDLYFPRDITLLRSADMVFCVIEDIGRNIGTATEIGMAYAWGKPIILVNLCSHIHSFQFLEKAATTVCYSLDRGLAALSFVVSAEGAVTQ